MGTGKKASEFIESIKDDPDENCQIQVENTGYGGSGLYRLPHGKIRLLTINNIFIIVIADYNLQYQGR